eukprot:TRINITY_DN2370_c0_g1_i1.p1 TRINITY_DN2370_c0_g1~~TRINITY_DN2370_c0_g1_i1.p1  ORF type:complete len:278 (+),score=156.44 TRINITY_DN2370_c0_g1_i1:112-945(+)
MVKLFSEFGKASKDLLEKEYTVDHKVKLEARDARAKLTASLARTASGALSGDVSAAFPMCPHADLTVKATTGGGLSAESVIPKLVKGLKITLKAASSGDGALSLDGQQIDYAPCDSVAARLKGDLTKGQLTAQAAFGVTRELTLGAQAALATARPGAPKADLGALYAFGTTQAALETRGGLAQVAAGFHHRVSAAGQIGAELVLTRATGRAAVALGAQTGLAGGDFVKARVTSAGVAAVAYSHGLAQGLTAVASAQIDFLQAGKDVHKFGLSFTFSG